MGSERNPVAAGDQPREAPLGAPEAPPGRLRDRLGWLAGFWLASVLALAGIALPIRWVLKTLS